MSLNNEKPTDSQPDKDDYDQFDEAFDALDDKGEPSGDNDDPVGDIADDKSGTVDAEDDPPLDNDSGSGDPEETAGTDDEPPATDKKPSNDDIWGDAPEPLRDAYSNLERDKNLEIQSLKGHQSGQDRVIQQLQQRLAEVEAGKTKGDGDQSNSDDGEAGEMVDNGGNKPPVDSEVLKNLREEYGDVAGPILDLVEHQQRQLEAMSKPLASLSERQFEDHVGTQQTLLAEQHPDWIDVANDPRFAGWLQNTSPMFQQAFERNRQNIIDGREASEVIGKFKTELGITAPAPKTTEDNPDKQDPRRQQQLDASKDSAAGGSTIAARGIPKDDFDSSFDAFFGDKT